MLTSKSVERGGVWLNSQLIPDHLFMSSLEDTFLYLRLLGEWYGETPKPSYGDLIEHSLSEIWERLLPEHMDEVREEANYVFIKVLQEQIQHGRNV
ncbi:hypothetical protein [Alkalihalobacillus pseudalcaliphilus]|uniref:hypothetical protein n=1 Tax=Alkalihalobacillus pseudalcaliphilus TaxID=79884 RepID=UPI00064DF23F|nr:hypothetical protein [Alkalihalobacillus pseudalcaliphilus]KMK76812.1 hypothetical protein AB990_07855 [Alkalihalobacillus pseudalcaliphilus]